MRTVPSVALIFRPGAVREIAVEQTEIAAVAVNAMTGVLIAAAIFIPMLSLFTPALVAALTILFGPLAGFVVSSLYSRVECTVGRRLGGKASLDELYRIFAWSFLPVAVATLICGLILATLKNPSTVLECAVALPALLIFCCAIRNYTSNIIAFQQFTRTRGVVGIVLAFILFFILVAGGSVFLSFLLNCGTGEIIKYIFSQA